MRWLIDGNNVMGARPDGWWRDRRAARARLVDELEQWQRHTGDQAWVIFDGHDDAELTARSRAGLTITFSGGTGRDSADDVIAAVARSAQNPARLTVVTSDRRLAERLPEEAEQLGAGAFRRLLDEAAGEGSDQDGSDSAS